MKGGSRYGAGRPAYHNKVVSFRFIDVRQWAREGKLKPDNYFGWHWSYEGEETASIGIFVNGSHSLTLKYSCAVDGGERQNVSIPITLTRTPCYFGGEGRVWFICPHTGRRVAKLYLYRGRWYCRKALRLKYQSQSDDYKTRIHRQIEKLESKLANENSKPKGMHWATYNRIIQKIENCESSLDAAFFGSFCKMMGGL